MKYIKYIKLEHDTWTTAPLSLHIICSQDIHSLCRVVMPWALFVHGNFIIDSERRVIKVSNFEGAELKQYNFLGVVGR